ncbi:MAG: AgmX/PglI C-terminal domain-containing protein [Myxococcales bacterium]|nr:AgmX/PglI C-terminal domain-containing protein [Myxococcales bacterium]
MGKLNTGSDVTVFGHISPEAVRQVVRPALGTLRRCYDVGLATDAHLEGRVVVAFEIDGTGRVRSARDQGSVLPSRSVVDCVVMAFQKLRFPAPSGGPVRVVYPVFFAREASATPVANASPSPSLDVAAERWRSIEKTRNGGDLAGAARATEAWHAEAPTDVLALLALGEGAERTSRRERAARAYGSLLDLNPSSPNLTSHAGMRLARLDDDHALALAIDAYRQALLDRPSHPSRHRLLAYALYKRGATSDAFNTLLAALRVDFAEERFPGAKRVLKEDLALMGEALMLRAPSRGADVLDALANAGAMREGSPSLRVVLSWESDLSNLDLEVESASDRGVAGESYGDVTSGYGPEAWVLRGAAAMRAHTIGVRCVSRGPGGYAMGVVQTVDHDGRGTLRVRERPFVLTAGGERVALGTVGQESTAD